MSALPFYTEMSDEVHDRARAALNRELGIELDPISADAVIEQVWNVLVGHDKLEK